MTDTPIPLVTQTHLYNVFTIDEIDTFSKVIDAPINAHTVGAMIGDLISLAAERGQTIQRMSDDSAMLAGELAIYEERVRKHDQRVYELEMMLDASRRNADFIEHMHDMRMDDVRNFAMVIARMQAEAMKKEEKDELNETFETYAPNEGEAPDATYS